MARRVRWFSCERLRCCKAMNGSRREILDTATGADQREAAPDGGAASV